MGIEEAGGFYRARVMTRKVCPLRELFVSTQRLTNSLELLRVVLWLLTERCWKQRGQPETNVLIQEKQACDRDLGGHVGAQEGDRLERNLGGKIKRNLTENEFIELDK